MLEFAIRPAAGEEQHQAVDRNTASPAKRGTPAKLGRVDRAKRLGRVVALEAGPERVAFNAEHDVAALPVVAGFTAAESPPGLVVDGEVGETGGAERVVEVVVAEAAAAEHADIETGPVVHWRRQRRSLGVDGQIGAESRRHQAQHTERDGGEKNSLHCYPLSNCSDERPA